MGVQFRPPTDTVSWNVFLLTLGALVYVIGYNGIAAHHDFVPGALYGLAVVGNNIAPELSLSRWYVLLNLPLFVLAWKGETVAQPLTHVRRQHATVIPGKGGFSGIN